MALCTNCGSDNPDRAKFCLECGAALPAGEVRSAGARKMVTILFADVVGSTALGEQLDPETMRAGLARYFSAARTVLERHGGTVEKFIGDAVMAVFGIPLLHEDDALRAARAAVELRDEIARLNEQLSAERGLRVEFRIGVNSGMVVSGGDDGSGSFVTGDAVNVAARLEQAAGAGEVLIGDATFRLVRDYVRVESRAPIAAKGKSEAVGAYVLAGMVGGVGSVRVVDRPTSFVGRRRELARLGESFDDAVAERRCFLFTLLGSAGVGKSRLVGEFLAAHAAEASILRGRCLPYGEGITYWPIGEIVRSVSGFSETDDAATIGARIRAAVGSDPSAARLADLLTSMLNLATVNATAEERFWAVRRFLEAQAREQPVICLIEDIHWAESELLDLLENLADWTRDAPILLLCTARPELLEARPTWGGGKVNATTTLLEPLNAEATRQLVDGLLGDRATPELVDRILTTSEGNPLFAEEIVRMLTDPGVHEEVAIPTSIQAVIAARLDRLPAEERVVAETASVAGRVFERSAVMDLVRESQREAVPSALLGLTRKELVQPSAPDLTADEAFRFRHMLIRDTAYEALPKQERAGLHERFAAWLDRVAGDRADEYAEIGGYHLEQAVRYRRELGLDDAVSVSLAERAGERLANAGQRAFQRGDDKASSKLLHRAVGLLPPGKTRRTALLTLGRGSEVEERSRDDRAGYEQLAEEAIAAGDEADLLKAQMVEVLRRSFSDPSYVPSDRMTTINAAREQFAAAQDTLGLALAEYALAIVYLGHANWHDSRLAAERGLGPALEAGDDRLANSLRFLALNAATWDSTPAQEVVELADRLIEDTGPSVTRANMIQAQALAFAMLGDAARARARIRESLAIKSEIGDPDTAWAFCSAPVEMVLGDLEAAEAAATHSIAVLTVTGETGQRSTIHGLRARNSFDMGKSDAEVMVDVEQCRQLAAVDDTVSQLQWRAAMALLAAREGRIDEAKKWIDEGAAIGEAVGSDFLYEQALTAQDRGYIHAQAGELDDARRWYGQALEMFERKGDVMDAARMRERLAAL